MKGTYRIVDLNVQFDSRFPDIHEDCSDYRTDEPGEVYIRISPDDDMLKYRPTPEEIRQNPALVIVTEGYLESRACCREFARLMPERDTFLFHGSAVAVDGECYIFTAKSGTGKSTHTRLWRELLGERAVMVNDDKPMIRVTDHGAIVYGTPWNGKHHLGANIAVPLKSICILERSADNQICKVSKDEALPMLVQQAHRPNDPAALARTMTLIDKLQAPIYRLRCNMDISAAELSYNAMKG